MTRIKNTKAIHFFDVMINSSTYTAVDHMCMHNNANKHNPLPQGPKMLINCSSQVICLAFCDLTMIQKPVIQAYHQLNAPKRAPEMKGREWAPPYLFVQKV